MRGMGVQSNAVKLNNKDKSSIMSLPVKSPCANASADDYLPNQGPRYFPPNVRWRKIITLTLFTSLEVCYIYYDTLWIETIFPLCPRAPQSGHVHAAHREPTLASPYAITSARGGANLARGEPASFAVRTTTLAPAASAAGAATAAGDAARCPAPLPDVRLTAHTSMLFEVSPTIERYFDDSLFWLTVSIKSGGGGAALGKCPPDGVARRGPAETFACLANGVDHSPCCAAPRLPHPVLDLCAGNLRQIDFFLLRVRVLASAPRRVPCHRVEHDVRPGALAPLGGAAESCASTRCGGGRSPTYANESARGGATPALRGWRGLAAGRPTTRCRGGRQRAGPGAPSAPHPSSAPESRSQPYKNTSNDAASYSPDRCVRLRASRLPPGLHAPTPWAMQASVGSMKN
ncbi:Protein of unknown function [Gryllus bimaculatus]|nr:Protein of unknown function [Gryllus bimaculatus]